MVGTEAALADYCSDSIVIVVTVKSRSKGERRRWKEKGRKVAGEMESEGRWERKREWDETRKRNFCIPISGSRYV